jgi:hypothetical protein
METCSRPYVPLLIAGCILSFCAVPASAQTASQRPYKGVFGGGVYGDPDHTFDVSLSMLEGYDDNLVAATGGGVRTSAPVVGGLYSMFGANGAYDWRGRGSQFGVTAATVGRYYNDAQTFVASHAAGVGFSTQLPKRTILSVDQSFAYSPSYLMGLFPQTTTPTPGDAPAVGADYAVNTVSSYQYGTRASISRGLTRRGTVSAAVEYRSTDFLELEAEAGRTDRATTQARIQFSRGVSRSTSLRVAYRYSRGDIGSTIVGYVPGGTSTEHGFDVGVDYLRTLSATRRMRLGFGVGSSAADLPLSSLAAAVTDDRQYNVLGEARFEYQFQRTWSTRARYQRRLEYIAELAEPVYSGGFAADMSGLLTPKVELSAAFGLSNGRSAAFRRATAYDTYTANVRLSRALSRTLALYTEYLYYFYDFRNTQLQPGVPSTMERNGVRVGLTLWLPIFRR